jgi:hypothetical protein
MMGPLEDGGPVADAVEPEWRCRFCGTANPPGAGHCKSCGAVSDAAAMPFGGSSTAPSTSGAEANPRPGGGKALAAIAVVSALLGSAAAYLARQPDAEAVTVAGFEWERGVEIQDHETVREEAWRDELPPGARIIARRRQVRRTEREQVGTREGKPVFRERPVYGHRVAYDVEKWSVTRTLKASGKDKSPRWPDIRLNLGEREGKRSETYVVLLQGRKLYRIKVPRERWLEMREGRIGSAVVGKDGAVLELR